MKCYDINDIKTSKIKVFCHLPFTHMKINVNGDMLQCCYQGKYLGNILKQPIEEIWNSKTAREIRKVTLRNKLHPNCQEWGGCPFINADLKKTNDFYVYDNLPNSLEIDLSSKHCNIGGENPSDDNPACIMCPRNDPEFRTHPFWETDKTLQIIEAIKPVVPILQSFSILGVSEPFWRNKIFDIFDVMEFKKYKKNINFWTYTNGSIFNETVQKKFLEYTDRSLLFFSIDAATKETYIKIRRRDFLEIIKNNIKKYNSLRSPSTQQIQICNNINTLNVHEMKQMVELAHEVGADEVRFNPTHNGGLWDDFNKDISVNQDNIQQFIDYAEQAKERAKELGICMLEYKKFEQTIVTLDTTRKHTTSKRDEILYI